MAIQKITSGIIQDGAIAAADIVSVANTAITGNITSSQIAPDQTLNGNVSVSGTGALTLPVGTTAQRPSPVTGMSRINSTTGFQEYYNGTSWISVVGSNPSLTQKAIFGYGTTGAVVSMTNLVSNTGVVATDVTGVGAVRGNLAASGYGTDKAIFGYGYNGAANVSVTNLVSNTGVVATDTTGVGTARYDLAAAGYGTDKAIFGYGADSYLSMTNLVSNTGVVSTDVTGVGTARHALAAAGFSLS